MTGRAAAAVLAIAAGACGGSSDDTDAGTQTRRQIPDAEPEAPSYTLTAKITDSEGTPLAEANASICGNACFYGTAGADGTLTKTNLPAATYVMQVGGAKTDARALSKVAFSIVIDSNRTLDKPVRVPIVGSKVPITGAVEPRSLGAGLTLIAGSTGLTLPAGADENAPFFAGAKVAADASPAYVFEGKKVLDYWALAPFTASSDVKSGVQIDNTYSLAAGASASLFTLNVTTGEFEEAVTLTVSSDGKTLGTAEQEGISKITWLALAVPQ